MARDSAHALSMIPAAGRSPQRTQEEPKVSFHSDLEPTLMCFNEQKLFFVIPFVPKTLNSSSTMQSTRNSSESARTRVKIVFKDSWPLGTKYCDMLDPLVPFPKRPYRSPHETLTPRDKFTVEFCEHAERLKGVFTG